MVYKYLMTDLSVILSVSRVLNVNMNSLYLQRKKISINKKRNENACQKQVSAVCVEKERDRY